MQIASQHPLQQGLGEHALLLGPRLVERSPTLVFDERRDRVELVGEPSLGERSAAGSDRSLALAGSDRACGRRRWRLRPPPQTRGGGEGCGGNQDSISGHLREVAGEASKLSRPTGALAKDSGCAHSIRIGARAARAPSAAGALARNERRTAGRRRARERALLAAGKPPVGEAVDEALAREDARHAVIEVLKGLPEPYRTTVVLRYFENVSPSEIGRRLAVPGATVRTRLRRGLEQLRTALDQRHGGDRQRWSMALIGLALPGPGAAPPGRLRLASADGAAAVAGKACLAVALIAGVWLALWQVMPANTAPPSTTELAGPPAAPRAAEPAANDAPAAAHATAAAARTARAALPPPRSLRWP